MPVNFGQLQNIMPPSVLAQLPVRPNPTDQFAGGIMSGILQGQQMQGNAQAMRAQKQQMDQEAQLQPGRMQIQQQTIAGNDIANQSSMMDLKNKEAAQQAAAQLRQAASQGEASYLDYLSKTNPDAVQTYNLKKAQISESISKQASNYAEADKKKADAKKGYAESSALEVGNAGKITHEAALLMNSVSGIKDPQAREQAYQQSLQFVSPATLKVLPPKYDEQVAAVVMNKDKLNYADAIDNLHKETDARTPKAAPGEVEKNVQLLHDLKAKFDAAEPGSTAQKTASEDYNNATKQIKNTNSSLWGMVGSKFADNLTPAKPNNTTPVAAVPEGRVAVVGPDGQQYHLPKTQVEEAKKQGYKVIGQ